MGIIDTGIYRQSAVAIHERGTPHPHPSRTGFSLVELSIVLVILGLLTGGILAGQSLIRAAELRSITADYQRYVTAAQTFRDQYMALPGDMADATRFWNRQANESWCAGHSGAAVASPGVCNGNGDGRYTTAAAANQSGETFQLWRHLALAGLIEGSYDGLAGPDSYDQGRIGITVPAAKIPNTGFGIYNAMVASDTTNMYAGDYWNTITFGTAAATSYPYRAALKPEEAWNIDTKLDDGRPGYGKVRSWRAGDAYTPNCADNASAASAQYNIGVTSIACALLFPRAF